MAQRVFAIPQSPFDHFQLVGNPYNPLNLPISVPAYAWCGGENYVTSSGNYCEVDVQGLPRGAKELDGEFVKVVSKTPFSGKFKCEPKTNPECFAEVLAHQKLTVLPRKLISVGFEDLKVIIKRAFGAKAGSYAISVSCDEMEDMNAYADLLTGNLVFGTSNGRWFLCSDGDVAGHEFGHALLHSFNKNLGSSYSGEGRAIHEGFGDALVALVHNSPVISEDFIVAIGRNADRNSGLRNVDNDKTVENTGSEEHDRGQAYGGFFWGLKKRLQAEIDDSRRSADIVLRILINHAGFYQTVNPTPEDFVKAVLRGTEMLAEYGADIGVSLDKILQMIVAEAFKRKMIVKQGDVLKPDPQLELWVKGKDVPHGFKDEPELIDKLREPKLSVEIDRRPSFSTPVIGGEYRYYQQYYPLRNGGKAKVLGAGLVMNVDSLKRQFHVSKRDIVSFKRGEIDETVSYSANQARAIVRKAATEELNAAKAAQATYLMDVLGEYEGMNFEDKSFSIRELERKFYDAKNIPLNERQTYRDRQLRVRAANAAVRKAAGMFDNPELVVIPWRKRGRGYEKGLFYQFKMGLAFYYVNVKTGQVVVEVNAIV